ncbi:GIY-YIG nuclease family protein [Sphingomonas oligophenolica]|uniref:GIY-YIG nuclease family protein n=1 Tax=Sphingomonas oligophenolica TaxID=301154 RepID=A0ABU9Y6L2_9SPHN
MPRSSLFYETLDELIAAKDGLFVPEVKKASSPADDQARLFLEIVAFRERYGREPDAQSRSPEEMRLGVRLAAFRKAPEKARGLANFDQYELLTAVASEKDAVPASLDDLIASGDDLLVTPDDHIFEFRATPAPMPKAESDMIAERVPCKEFEKFAPIFDEFVSDIASGVRTTVPTNSTYQIATGDMFIVDGQLAYIADVGAWMTRGDQKDARLRIVYDNGTESDHLLRSFGKALYRADNSRRVVSPEAGPLFYGRDLPVTGCIYVARTLSDDPALIDLRDHILKLGSTTGAAANRLAGAENDPTFLLARARVVTEYETRGVPPKKIEGLVHRFFAGACVNVQIPDRFGRKVDPREWFFVSPESVDQAMRLIATRKLHLYDYEVGEDRLIPRS